MTKATAKNTLSVLSPMFGCVSTFSPYVWQWIFYSEWMPLIFELIVKKCFPLLPKDLFSLIADWMPPVHHSASVRHHFCPHGLVYCFRLRRFRSEFYKVSSCRRIPSQEQLGWSTTNKCDTTKWEDGASEEDGTDQTHESDSWNTVTKTDLWKLDLDWKWRGGNW